MPEELRFTQPSTLRNQYDILQGEEVAGKLEFKKLSTRKAEAVMDGQAYHIVRTGIMHSEVVVTPADSDETVATYQKSPMKRTGEVRIGDNRYTFARTSKMLSTHSEYAWQDPEGKNVVTYRMGGVVRSMGEIAVGDMLAESPDRQILIPLGLFNSLNQEDDGSGAAAAAGGA